MIIQVASCDSPLPFTWGSQQYTKGCTMVRVLISPLLYQRIVEFEQQIINQRGVKEHPLESEQFC